MDHKYIVVGVDGTDSDAWMKPDGSNSHVYKFVKQVRGAEGIDRLFLHGPTQRVLGKDTEPIIQQAVDFIYNRLATLFPGVLTNKIQPLSLFDMNNCKQKEAQNLRDSGYPYPTPFPRPITKGMLMNQKLSTDDVRIVLVGHSRGGLAVTHIARMLSPVIRVYFMGLYDSVDMHPCLDGMKVENVKFVVHARRHPDVGSRKTFRNTSLHLIDVDKHEEEFFYTSHGGIGGDFVTTYREAGWDGDFSCIPKTTIRKGFFYSTYNTNQKLVDRNSGQLMDEICANGSRKADEFMREQAIRFGVYVY